MQVSPLISGFYIHNPEGEMVIKMEEIEIVELEPLKVVGMRARGAYHDTGKLLPKLFEHVIGSGMEITGPPVYLCHELTMAAVEEAMKNNNADLEVAIPVSGKIVETDQISHYELPGVKMVKTIHKGPYEKVGDTYNRLFAWMAENGKEVKGPYREYYMNDPKEVPPEEILTEVYAQIE
jgi:effector-binding domain-containing protein